MKKIGQQIKDSTVFDFYREFNSFQYEKKCEQCGENHIVQTQDDDNPEYYSNVYIKCKCGEFVLFKLPVN